MSEPAEVPVNEVMSERLVTINTTETLSDALDRFQLTGLRHLVVIDEGARARVWSRTVRSRPSGRALLSPGCSAASEPSCIRAVPSSAPRTPSGGCSPCWMGVDALPVVDESDEVVGIVTGSDLLRVLARSEQGVEAGDRR